MNEHSALLYDAIYSLKNYEQEAAAIADLIQTYHPQAQTILDVACGTGAHAQYFAPRYVVDGIDLNPQYIEVAAQRNPNSRFWVRDMTDFQLPSRYDVITCLFSAIGYVKSLENLERTVQCFQQHLNPGGVILIEPWFSPSQWMSGRFDVVNYETADLKICRMYHGDQEDQLSILNFEYLVGSAQGIQHIKERHELGLFHPEEMLTVLQSTGMQVTVDPEGISGRGLYILHS